MWKERLRISFEINKLKFVIVGMLISMTTFSQGFQFSLKTSPTVNLVFNTIEKYQDGLVQYNFLQLNIETDRTWDLYVGANTSVQGEWDEDLRYSSSGTTPLVDILELRFRNAQNTSQEDDFFPIRDVNDPVYIIGSDAADVEKACGLEGANAAGSYLTAPGCYQFNLDLKIKPGFTYRPGLYRMEIVFTLYENL